MLPAPGVAADSGLPGSESHCAVYPATPVGGAPLSVTDHEMVPELTQPLVLGPDIATVGADASGTEYQFRPHARSSALTEPQPVARS